MKEIALLMVAALFTLSAANRIYLNRIGPSASELFIAHPDGSGERKLFATSGFDYGALFSADDAVCDCAKRIFEDRLAVRVR
jgi:hypothetical protein